MGRDNEDGQDNDAPSAIAGHAGVSLRDLFSRLVPPTPTDEDMEQLQRLLEDIQRNPPEDKERFARMIGRILDTACLRLQIIDSGKLSRLQIQNGSLVLSHLGGGRRGFHSTAIRVVRVPDDFARKGLQTDEQKPMSQEMTI